MAIDIRDYDTAVLQRFQYYYPNTHWVHSPILPLTELRSQRWQAGGEVQFPVLLLRRIAAPLLYKDTNSWAAGRSGDEQGRVSYNTPGGTTVTADLTMVQTNYELRYMLDVFAYERDNFDALVVETQENLYRHPYVTLPQQSGPLPDLQLSGVSTNIVGVTIDDTTDLESHRSATPLYRATLQFQIRAYIYRKYTALLLEHVSTAHTVHTAGAPAQASATDTVRTAGG